MSVATRAARLGPQHYLCEEGAYALIPHLCRTLGYRRVLLVHGDHGIRVARPFLEAAGPLAQHVDEERFGGECTRDEAERLAAVLREGRYDAILGVGGGKVLDASKAAGVFAGDLPVLLAPTLVSNCAPWSYLSVFYSAEGRPLGHEVFDTQPKALVLEPRVLIDSPVEAFVAGLADTLAKWVECADGVRALAAESPGLMAELAASAVERCRAVPLERGEAAVADHRAGRVSADWLACAETVIAAAGMVGGFGGRYGGATAAHAIHDGVSAFPAAEALPHGVKVAYGVMAQLALQARWADVAALLPWYRALGLPATLADLGIRPDAQAFATVARVATQPSKTIHELRDPRIPTPVSADAVARAVRELEHTVGGDPASRTAQHEGAHQHG